MDIHKNARLSFRSRESLARFVIEQGAVSAKTAAKWIVRFRASGLEPQLQAAHQPLRRWNNVLTIYSHPRSPSLAKACSTRHK